MAVKYLVTGAAGNLGGSVARKLLEKGEDIRALVLPNDETVSHLPDGVELFEGDILDTGSLERFFCVPENTEIIVIHMAGIVTTNWKFNKNVYDVNVGGTKNIVNQCVASKVRKLVYVSSVHAIPELPKGEVIKEITQFYPEKIVGFYGKTKAEASQIVMDAVREHDLNASIVFPGGLCGPYDYSHGHVTQLLIDSTKNKLPGGIEGGYDFVDVRDVAKGIIACCEKGGKGENYILTNRYVSVRELLDDVHALTGARRVKVMFPAWFVRLLLPFFALHYKVWKKKPLFTKYSLYTLISNSLFSNEKAKKELGYKVRPFRETLRDAIMWQKRENI